MDEDSSRSLPLSQSCDGGLGKADSAGLSMDERGRLRREDDSTGGQDSFLAIRTPLLPGSQVKALVAVHTLPSIQRTCSRGSWTSEDLGSSSIYWVREAAGIEEEGEREEERYEDYRFLEDYSSRRTRQC